MYFAAETLTGACCYLFWLCYIDVLLIFVISMKYEYMNFPGGGVKQLVSDTMMTNC